jgi:porin
MGFMVFCCGVLSVSAQEAAQESKEQQSEEQIVNVQQATLFPIPDYTGSLLDRTHLTGDWAGLREDLAKDAGIQVEVNAQQYYQGVTGGGPSDNGDGRDNGTADYRVMFDSGQSGLWPGGFIELHGESYWGHSINFYSGAVIPVNFDQGMQGAVDNGTYLSHAILTQFLTERFGVILGKIDTSAGDANDYAHGVGDQQFMNGAFNLNPVTYLSSPYSVLGGGFVYLLGDEKESMFTMMVYDGEGAIDESGFDTIDQDRTTLGTGLRLKTDFFEKKGHQTFGIIVSDGDFDGQADDPRILLPNPPLGFVKET